MKDGYAIERNGIYELRIEGEAFSKTFCYIRELRRYAKQNSIRIAAIYEDW